VFLFSCSQIKTEKGKLMILIPEFKIHGNLKIKDTLVEDAKTHVGRLIQLLEML
jgi:hypothetical protein